MDWLKALFAAKPSRYTTVRVPKDALGTWRKQTRRHGLVDDERLRDLMLYDARRLELGHSHLYTDDY